MEEEEDNNPKNKHMKKIILLFTGMTFAWLMPAQEISDALRYGQDQILGTARFRGLSGAFGALGGDMSAVSINPAGSAVFNSSHASVSTSILSTKTDTQFFDGNYDDCNTELDLNQAGVVLVFKNTNENTSMRKFTLGFAFDKVSNYRNYWYAYGTNPNNSIAEYFLSHAQGKRLDEISRFEGESYSDAYADIGYYYGYGNQQAFLGYEAYILDPDPNDPNYVTDPNAVTSYISNIAGNSFQQDYEYAARGYNGKLAINFAAQVGEKIYLGLNLNSHFLNYDRSTLFYESNNNAGSVVNDVRFENNLYTVGTGFSFQLGSILKLNKEVRVGLTYNSPTWLSLEEETTQYLATVRNESGSNSTLSINPNVVNIFPKYRLQTPGKLTGSIAYVFEDKGLISFDYSHRDYSNTKFKPTSDTYFSSVNSNMNSMLTSASTYRIGGEYKYKQFSFRGGYRFEESPYEDGVTIGDLTGYSLGLGYNFGNTKLDLTYDSSNRENQYQFFNTGLTDSVLLDNKNSNITLSLSFNL